MTRTHAELIRRPYNTATCPFFMPRHDAKQAVH